MAIRPDYVTGSLTLTSGSANFTTSGSALQAAAVQAGDEIITRSGNVLIIASITGQNSGTLMQPCPASAAGAGQPLRIRFQPDGSRYQGAARDLIEKLANGNVEALAGIDGATKTLPYFTGAGSMDAVAGAADTMPYFTGVNGMAATGLTAFARSLLDDNDAATMQATLGLTGNAIAQMALDSFGGYFPSSSGVDVDAAPSGSRGLYERSLPGAPNYPGVGFWWIETQRTYSNASKRQIATAYSSTVSPEPIIMVRVSSNSGTWGPWRSLNGESGSNSNGRYTRFADGTMLCVSDTVTITRSNDATSVGSWTFPAAFSEPPLVHYSLLEYLPAGFRGVSQRATGTTSAGTLYLLQNGAWPANFSTTARASAIGRWF